MSYECSETCFELWLSFPICNAVNGGTGTVMIMFYAVNCHSLQLQFILSSMRDPKSVAEKYNGSQLEAVVSAVCLKILYFVEKQMDTEHENSQMLLAQFRNYIFGRARGINKC